MKVYEGFLAQYHNERLIDMLWKLDHITTQPYLITLILFISKFMIINGKLGHQESLIDV